jgi:tRNA/tmRNA/rRNA uracil-C5-methylase (TrmA/RlmC/RlmD family)
MASLAAIEAIPAFSHHGRVSVPDSLPAGCEPTCHGCRHRQLDETASLAQKASYLARVLAPWADRIAPVTAPVTARRLGYRDRVTLTARWDAATGWRFGLMRRDELIPIHDCPVHTPRVRALVHLLVERLPPAAVLPLAYLHVCGAQATLIVKSHQADVALLDPVLEGLAVAGLEGLWLHQHPSAGRKLFARSGWKLVWGSARSRDAHGLLHGPTAFAQALPELHRASLDAAVAHLRPAPGVAVLDLYCGHGASLRAWTGAGSPSLGIELSGEAVELCRDNAPRASVLRGTCVQRLPQVRAWWGEQGGERVAYVNPPRSGLEQEIVVALGRELRPARLAYLSCSAGTLARDLRALAESGYEVRTIDPYDFFPLTHHVEALALLEGAVSSRRAATTAPASAGSATDKDPPRRTATSSRVQSWSS